jgi:hypothetical protein
LDLEAAIQTVGSNNADKVFLLEERKRHLLIDIIHWWSKASIIPNACALGLS